MILPLANERARAIKMGIPVTVQHPLLHDLAFGLIAGWGTKRTADVFPAREWLSKGALVGAGSDYPVGEYDAMMSVWGMVTRQRPPAFSGRSMPSMSRPPFASTPLTRRT